MQRPTPRHRRDADPVLSAPAAAGYASAGDSEPGGAELLEDRSIRITGGRHGRRVGISVPGAIGATFLVAALALGAAVGPLAPRGDAGSSGRDAGIAAADATEGSSEGDGAETPADPTNDTDTDIDTDIENASEAPDATEGPAATDKASDGDDDGTDAEPTDTPDLPPPAVTALDLGLAIDGKGVAVEWSACATDDFAALKIVRSKDEFATWPMGAGDSLAAVIESPAAGRFVDRDVDGGRTYRYLVVGLRHWNGELAVACRSAVKAIETPAPEPAPTDKPDATQPPSDGIELAVVIKEGHPFLDWSACAGIDFDYYKVVRSTDSTVTWPKGDNDSLVTAIGADGETKAWDGESPTGKKVWYRVFCVVAANDGYVVKAASPVRGVEVPAGEPAPEPVSLGFEADVTGEGVILSWEACGSDLFHWYKVVRSTWTENPSYLPYTDGTEVIGVIENAGTTQLVDSGAESGQTVYYRVQCIGYWNGEKTLLGQTTVIAVTIP